MFTQKRPWRLIGLFLAICLLAIGSTAAFAFEGRGDEDRVIIEADEVIADDLYVGANTLIINGTVEGDLFVAANEIEINGTVNGDVIGGGNSLVVNGTVGDDVLFGGTAIIIANGASVIGDVLAAGTGLEIAPEATVGNDVLFGAMGARLDGTIGGDVTGGGNGIEINGTISGNVNLDVTGADETIPFDPMLFNPNAPANTPQVNPGLYVGGNASIGGDFSYASTQSVEVPSSAVEGTLSFDETIVETAEQQTVTQQLLDRLSSAAQRWVIVLLLGLLVIRFMPNLLKGSAEQLNSNLGGGALSGTLLYFGWPIALVISLIVIILLAVLLNAFNLSSLSTLIVGVGLALIIIELILFILALTVFCTILVGWLIGSRIIGSETRPIIPLAVGTFIIVLLSAIPVLGALVRFIVGIAGLGALWLWWRNGRDSDEGLKTAAAV